MSGSATARVQLCGRYVVEIDGSRFEDDLPGRKGRLLFAYLVLNRHRALPRDELLMAGWGEDAPAEARSANPSPRTSSRWVARPSISTGARGTWPPAGPEPRGRIMGPEA